MLGNCVVLCNVVLCDCVQEPELPTNHPAQEPLLLLCAQLGYHHHLLGGRGQQPAGGVQEPGRFNKLLPPCRWCRRGSMTFLKLYCPPSLTCSFTGTVMVDWRRWSIGRCRSEASQLREHRNLSQVLPTFSLEPQKKQKAGKQSLKKLERLLKIRG